MLPSEIGSLDKTQIYSIDGGNMLKKIIGGPLLAALSLLMLPMVANAQSFGTPQVQFAGNPYQQDQPQGQTGGTLSDQGQGQAQVQPQPQSASNTYFSEPVYCGGFNLLRPSDHGFDSMISPMTNPLFFEDPRTLTEARAIYANHNVPAAVGGGSVHFMAVQMRFAINDRLSLIATKDGYMTSTNPLIDDGWADVALGFKLNLFRDPYQQSITSVGFTYDIPVGSTRSLQGNGDGEFHLFFSSARKLTQNINWITAGGIRLPLDGNAESTSTYSSNHIDFRMTQRTYLLAECNWFHWIDNGGNAATGGIEGHDLFNFGSNAVDGNSLLTIAAGGKFKPGAHSELGVAFEVPVGRQHITSSRLTADWIIRY